MAVIAAWKAGNEFEVQFPQGERLILNSVPAAERPASGPSPMDAVLAAVAGCTGIDIVMILEKMRKPPSRFHMEIHPTRREEQPRIFTDIELVYHLEGEDITPEAASRAVALSLDKYCSVAAMLRPTVRLSARVVLNGEALAA